MLLDSQLVFEGVVTRSYTKLMPNGIIGTRITFTVLDVISGHHAGNTLTLEFLGGSVSSTSTMISGMKFPMPGEHGIYFVEAPGRKQVNPFYGWNQGHFIVKKDPAGTERVMTNRGHSVIGIQDIPASTHASGISSGIARGIVAADSSISEPALSIQEFKYSLRQIINQHKNQIINKP
jgi:hypothetical protein